MGRALRQIGRYQVSRQTAETAALALYDAYDPEERCSISVGILQDGAAVAPESAKVGHPGWINILRSEEDGGVPFLIMEPFNGKPLDESIRNGHKLPFSEGINLLKQLAAALDHAHSCGSVHGNLQPANVLVNDSGEVKILAVCVEDRPEQLLQSVHYLSPERLRSTVIDARSDQFSLAVLACRLLTGELPFPGESAVGVIFRVVFQALETSPMRELPHEARMVFERALNRDPERRFASCIEMVAALDAALAKRVVPSPTRVLDSPALALPSSGSSVRSKGAASGSLSQIRTDGDERARNANWFGRHRESLKLFTAVFAGCVVLFSAMMYVFVLRHEKPTLRASPVAAPPVVVPKELRPPKQVIVPTSTHQAPEQRNPKQAPAKSQASKQAKVPAITHQTQKKANPKSAPVKTPEIELKPVEPKFVRP